MSHNAAFVCVNDTLHVFGGQYRNYTVGRGATARGVFHATALTSQPNAPLVWGPQSLQLEGYHPGCVERRAKFNGYCEFDGLFSAVYFKERFFLFGRANTAPAGGARHVQVTSAPADLTSWSAFRVVQLAGIKVGRSDSNIYFFQVQVLGDQMLALFPAVFPPAGSGGIYASTSSDGVEWARPQRLLPADAACARTRIHPVRLIGSDLYLYSNVDISEPLDIPHGHTHVRGATRPYLQKVHVDVVQQTFVGTEKLSQASTFLVANATGLDVPVRRVGNMSKFV